MKFLYELTIVIYVMMILASFIHLTHDKKMTQKIAFWLLCTVWAIQTFFLFQHFLLQNSFPIGTLRDSLFFYSWILVSLSLIINKLLRIHFIVLLMNLFSFIILLFYFSLRAQREMPYGGIEFVHEILIAHISLTIVSYGFFTISFLFSIAYIIQYRFLKEKKGMKWIRHLGNLIQLDKYSFQSITVGVPLLFIGLLLGFVWAFMSNETETIVDFKTIGSMFVISVYVMLLFLRLIGGYQGKTLANYNVAAFLILLINFFLFSLLSDIHFI